ncbi:MAG: hypothetical protein J6P16_02195 [Eubacterium sp.]|nr:hypothetical protein [Eubacterium sp.]
MAKKVLVIRVGSRTTHIVHMENVDDDPSIYGCMRVTTPEGCVQDGQIMDVTDLARMIMKAMKDKHISCKEAIFVIPSSKIASREATMPAVNKQRMGPLVQARVGDLFPVDTDQYVFSHVLQGTPYVGGEGTKLATEKGFDKLLEAENATPGEDDDKKKKKKKKSKKDADAVEAADDSELVQDVLVFAAPTDLINSYYTLADAIGVKIVALEADGNSVFQIMKRQVGAGTSLSIQINRDSTLVNVINQDKLLLQRVVPYGVNVFTDAIQEEAAFRCDTFDKAYKLISSQKVLLPNLGIEGAGDDFSMQKRVAVTNNGDYLIGNIVRVVEYYNAQHRGAPIENVSLIGWGCSIVGIHELLSNELGIPTTTPTQIAGVRFNRKVEISVSMLQYLNCMGAVFSPVNFVPKDLAARDAKKGSLVGPIIICGLLVIFAGVIAMWSYLSLFTAQDERDSWQAKVNSMAGVEPRYNELMAVQQNYVTYNGVKIATDLNNNHLHALLDDIEATCPKSFKISTLTSDGKKIVINAVSNERLLSIPSLIIQLNKIPIIRNVWVEQISEDQTVGNNKFRYTYSLTCDFIADELKIRDLVAAGLSEALLRGLGEEAVAAEAAAAETTEATEGTTEEGTEAAPEGETTEGGDQ